MGASSEILKAIRVDVFDLTQEKFAAKLGYAEETVNHWERGRTRLAPKHLREVKLLRAPHGQTERLNALLREMESALLEEKRARGGFAKYSPSVQAALSTPEVPVHRDVPSLFEKAEAVARRAEVAVKRVEELHQTRDARDEATARRVEEAAQRAERLGRAAETQRAEDSRKQEQVERRVEQAAQRAEQLCREEEARRAEGAREREEVTRRVEQVSQRFEQRCQEQEARRAEDAREREEGARRVEQTVQRAEQLCREVEAGRAAEAREREEAARWVEQAAQQIEQRFHELLEAADAEGLRKWEEATSGRSRQPSGPNSSCEKKRTGVQLKPGNRRR